MVGFGAIGQLIAGMIENYPCPICFYDPFVDKADFPRYKNTSLEDLFRSCDVVSIHLPVTDDTRGMIDGQLFSLMKKDAIFINTARAVVVNRNDLYDILAKNLIRGAILDVFDQEPPDDFDNKIINLPNVMATPHIAGATFEVEDHHVAIMNAALTEWFVLGSRKTDKIYNKQVVPANIQR